MLGKGKRHKWRCVKMLKLIRNHELNPSNAALQTTRIILAVSSQYKNEKELLVTLTFVPR